MVWRKQLGTKGEMARTGEIAIEELTIAHEGLRLVEG